MSFLTPKPNLRDGEKARIEYYLQRIAECIGAERFQLPIQSMRSLLDHAETQLGGQTPQPEKFIGWLGEHFSHNVSGLKLAATLGLLNKSSGGG